MIKSKPRYLRLTLLIMANTATSAIETAENKGPEVGVLRNMRNKFLNNFTLIANCSSEGKDWCDS